MKLIPREGGGWMVMTNLANRSAEHVVVATGAWSRQLLDPLGIKVALETERGYHAMLFDPEVMPALADQQQDARLRRDADGGRAARGRHGGDRRPGRAAERGTRQGRWCSTPGGCSPR